MCKNGGWGLERSLTALGIKHLKQYKLLKRTLTRVIYVCLFFHISSFKVTTHDQLEFSMYLKSGNLLVTFVV